MVGNFEDSKRSEEMKQSCNFKERFFHTPLNPNSGQVEPRSSSLQSMQALIDEQIRAIQVSVDITRFLNFFIFVFESDLMTGQFIFTSFDEFGSYASSNNNKL